MPEVKKIAVIGLGYVGLPLALLAEEKGFNVIGIEKNSNKLSKLKSGTSLIDDEYVNRRIKKTKITFSGDVAKIRSADIAIVCVPTPVDNKKMPDLSFVEDATLSAAKNLKNNSLLVIESTINPGVCDEVLIPTIEKKTKHKIGKTLHIAHCPERINPGDKKWNVGNINRVLGSNSKEGLDLAYNFYKKLISGSVKKMGSIKEAEAVKIVENSFRDINIAFVNELAVSFNTLGINVVNVIEGAATKPFAFIPHYPGLGVGGHCIPIDPYYLIEYARSKGFDHKFLSIARNINESMPIYAVDLLEKKLIEVTKRPLKGKSIAVLGISYKPDVGDDRESPAYPLIKELKKRGATVHTYDPYILDKSTVNSAQDAIDKSEAVVIATSHKEFKDINAKNFSKIKVLLDGRNLLADTKEKLEKLGVSYLGIGVQ